MALQENLHVSIIVSDPWGFGCGPFPGVVIRKGDDKGGQDYYPLLIKFDSCVEYQGEGCQYFVAKPRDFKQSIEGLPLGETLTCSMITISKEQAEQESPFDISRWRGGCALLADVKRREVIRA